MVSSTDNTYCFRASLYFHNCSYRHATMRPSSRIQCKPPSFFNLPKTKEQRDKKQQKSRERSQAKRRPYPTSSRYMRLMSTSPRRFRKYTADAATGILPCSCCCCCCYSRVPPRSPPDLAAARRSLSLFSSLSPCEISGTEYLRFVVFRSLRAPGEFHTRRLCLYVFFSPGVGVQLRQLRQIFDIKKMKKEQ